ncbi:MAG TPA: response regulator [Polyangiaceae bacterium]
MRHNTEVTAAPGLDKPVAGRSLLVVEDDDDIREALVLTLSREGFRVTACANGREALDLLREQGKPDLILLDLMMPVMDGWQFRVEQKEDPELSSIPVIALSADVTAKAVAIDVDAYLEKPAEPQILIDTIERLLVLRQHRDLQARLAQTDRLTSLGTLAAGVAHQINNPLAYVLLNLDFIGEELEALQAVPGGRAHELRLALSQAREGASRIGDIVQGLKTFSRPENDAVALLEVTPVLEATLAMVANELRHGARLVKDFQSVPEVMANEARLGQVFLNLLLNALQALPPGRGEENEIRVVVHAPAPERVVIEVHDNGVGIAPQVRGRIFEPFFTTKPVGVGTGLGLAICHGIVTSLGGTLSVESEPGKGSAFRVELPAAAHAPRASSGENAAPSPSTVPPAQRRILIIDDEPIVGFSLERLLADEGQVVALTSAKLALARITAGERFDLLLCDVMMPGMDAPALYDALREVAPDQAERMVFMTGGAFTPRAHDFLERVPNTRLDKPFDIKALLTLVQARMA